LPKATKATDVALLSSRARTHSKHRGRTPDFYPDLVAIEEVFQQLSIKPAEAFSTTLIDPQHRAIVRETQTRNLIRIFRAGGIPWRSTSSCENFGSRFLVSRRGEKTGTSTLNVPGEHNVHNALGVIALACELSFRSIRSPRRFGNSSSARAVRDQIRERQVLLVDDYGHHPTRNSCHASHSEIDRTAASRHDVSAATVSRERKRCCSGIWRAFDDADRVVITDVYPASETSDSRNHRPDMCR
jgi:UDP-N-acetylmuramate--alanine ligase